MSSATHSLSKFVAHCLHHSLSAALADVPISNEMQGRAICCPLRCFRLVERLMHCADAIRALNPKRFPKPLCRQRYLCILIFFNRVSVQRASWSCNLNPSFPVFEILNSQYAFELQALPHR